eukprot:gene2092-1526_t
MLEGDEVLDVAQETGYRLCRMANEEVEKKKEERQMVFSVTWDLNNNRRMFMCMQDGQLKTIDLDVPQQYESNYGRVVQSPGAPRQLDGTDFNGAECLVHDYGVRFRRFISPHEAPDRVTSLATSPRGQLMASGDEHGHVRIVMLQLLQELTGKSSSSASNPPGTPASHSTHTSGFASPAMHMLRHQQVHQQHSAPVVGSDGSVGGGMHTPRSMATANQHVPLFGGSAISSKNVRRPFQPNYDIPLHEVQRRLSAPPVFGQPGTSAEVTGPSPQKSSSSPATPATSNQTAPSMQSPTLGMRSALGSYHSLAAMPASSSSPPPHGDPAVEVSLLDDGRYLVSVLQPTDQPVIHVSMTNISGTMKRLRHFSGDVVVAVSDTVGKVYVYAADDGRLALTGGNGTAATAALANGFGDKADVFMLTSAQQATDFYIKQMRMNDWLRLEEDFDSDLDDDDDTDGSNGGLGGAALRPSRDPNAHPNQATQSNKPLTNAFGEPFVLKMPPTVPTLAKKSTLAPKPTASTAATAGNTGGAQVAITAGLMAAPSAASPSREGATWLADTLSRHAALTQPPPPPPSALSTAPPAAPTSAIGHKPPAMTLASSLALSDDHDHGGGGGFGAATAATADANAPPRPRHTAPKPTAPPSTSSLLRPTAAFAAKTSVANGPSAVAQATVKSKAKPPKATAPTAAAAAHDDAASVVSGASRGSRGGKSTYSFASRASSTGTAAGRSKRPTEDEIAYDEGIDEIEGLLPYPIDVQPSPFAQRIREQKAAARARARELQREGGDEGAGDGEDSTDDEEAKAFHRAQKVVAANEALTWTNPYAAPVLHSSRHVEAALQTVSGKLAALPLAPEAAERAKNRSGSRDSDEGDEAVRAYDDDDAEVNEDEGDAGGSGYFAANKAHDAAAAWDELTVSTVHTTQSDRRRAAQALQQYYQRHRTARTDDGLDDGAPRLPPAQYLDARDQDVLLQAFAANGRPPSSSSSAAAAGQAGRPVTGVWKKSAPAIATDYLARKEQFTLRAKDQEIFFPRRLASTRLEDTLHEQQTWASLVSSTGAGLFL